MSRSTDKVKRPIIAGLFLLLMVALVTALTLFVGQGKLTGNNKEQFVVIYDSSIMGLNVGAPVTLRGVKIGEVTNIKVKLYNNQHVVLNTVFVDIYPDTLVNADNEAEDSFDLNNIFEMGLGVKLKPQSLLTGLLYMEVDFYHDQSLRRFSVPTQHPQLATVPSDLELLTQDYQSMNLPELMADIRGLSKSLRMMTESDDFKSLPSEFRAAMQSFEVMAKQMGTSMVDMRDEFIGMAQGMEEMSTVIASSFPETNANLNKMLKGMTESLTSLQQTIDSINDNVAPDSPLMYQLERSARDVSHSARAIRSLADMLEEQPRALVSGKAEVD